MTKVMGIWMHALYYYKIQRDIEKNKAIFLLTTALLPSSQDFPSLHDHQFLQGIYKQHYNIFFLQQYPEKKRKQKKKKKQQPSNIAFLYNKLQNTNFFPFVYVTKALTRFLCKMLAISGNPTLRGSLYPKPLPNSISRSVVRFWLLSKPTKRRASRPSK